MKILLLGKNGQLGTHLQRVLPALGELTALGRAEADLSDPAAAAAAVAGSGADVVVNAAAYTAVDRAESEPELAQRVNAEAPGAMAAAARGAGALFVHYSTDYVFDGTGRRPYREDDPTRPLGVYGRTKLAGEQAVRAAGGPHLVFRTAWVYSLHGRNFLNTMLRLGAERSELRVVDDQVGSPTFAGAIADATVSVLARVPQLAAAPSGLYHMTCGGETSWCGFARRIFEEAGAAKVRVDAITTADYPTPAARPAYSVLNNEKLESVFGVSLPSWDDALRTCLAERSSER
jgi:dTDP-4-dehydrorhamnose reductase